MNILQQCDVKVNTENSVFWKHIPSLKAWIFSAKNPEPISVTCKKGKTEMGHITNSGILSLSAGCIARREHTMLIEIQILELHKQMQVADDKDTFKEAGQVPN